MYANKILRSLLVVAFLFLLPITGFANEKEGLKNSVYNQIQDQKPQTDQSEGDLNAPSLDEQEMLEQKPPSVSIFDFIKMIFALLFVLALLYGALKLINSRNKFDSGRSVENIGGTNLGNNKSLQLVKVGNSVLVVGVGDSINLLKEITDEQEREQLIQSYRDRSENMTINSDKLSSMVEKVKGMKKTKSKSSFSSLLQDQLGQLSKDRKKKLTEMDDKKEYGQ
ncbi:flagellar biosynthetic protein FliO [Sutcliffiella horikoshii]|uniref:flagellar biosynthetic protein FliO n=1 Tax=Sutcliffiella horikoshii TaxID=79883 RepID=UPI001CC0650E|nr:flagellar biosynthetic protein FliO [Sutcliffiella horikoshii]UAL49176.1 flagellar biosynthetic protein FliO [Sutcliffiella horikoshii]